MADRKYASWIQWSVMWYSETGAGRKMAVIVGGASCWAENRSRTSRACALERVVNKSRGRKKKKRRREEGREWKGGSPCGGAQRWTERKSNLPLATANGRLSIFPALTSAATMSSRAANEIILDTTLRGQPLHSEEEIVSSSLDDSTFLVFRLCKKGISPSWKNWKIFSV